MPIFNSVSIPVIPLLDVPCDCFPDSHEIFDPPLDVLINGTILSSNIGDPTWVAVLASSIGIPDCASAVLLRGGAGWGDYPPSFTDTSNRPTGTRFITNTVSDENGALVLSRMDDDAGEWVQIVTQNAPISLADRQDVLDKTMNFNSDDSVRVFPKGVPKTIYYKAVHDDPLEQSTATQAFIQVVGWIK